MTRSLANILVTGGCGFIGANFIRYILMDDAFHGRVVNLDALTYAGNVGNLVDVDIEHGGKRYFFERADVCDRPAVESIFSRYGIDTVVHFAAESHVDRSVQEPEAFVKTNVLGTYTMLDVARKAWNNRKGTLFHHVSTDEVFGSLGTTGYFTESTPYDPRSPYSATKAGSDHLVHAYRHTYGLPTTVTNCSNNYGPFQFPEKLVPLMILNMVEGRPLPVYGEGKNIRDWLYVEDHASAIWLVMRLGKTGESYTVGGGNECENLTLVHVLCEKVAAATGKEPASLRKLITFVKDRPGHDLRYAIDCSRIKNDLKWRQSVDFDTGLELTVRWYIDNMRWVANVRSGAYREWIDLNYGKR
jgi:dTDP-glucose 4,6-dehydratase